MSYWCRFPSPAKPPPRSGPPSSSPGRAYNAVKPDVVVMAITSQLRASATLGEVWVQDWTAAGLIKPSAVKPVFATLERSLIVRQLGALNATDRTSLKKAIGETLG